MRTVTLGALRLLALVLLLGMAFPGAVAMLHAQDVDPDLPDGITGIDKEEYIQARDAQVALIRGLPYDLSNNPRIAAIAQMQAAQKTMLTFVSSGFWTEIGPAPIPNGQTTTTSTPVSGRVTAIVVDPTDANILYIGTAQGGIYRTLNGGTTWTAIFDNAASLAIGALTLAPTDRTILYVGTGEANGSCDSFFGVGLYRINNANTAPILNGPFNPTPTNDVIGGKTFTGRTISKILVDPANPDIIFVSTGSGIGGLGCDALAASPPVTALRGIFRCTNATSGSPSFTKLTVVSQGNIAPDVTGNRIINDMIYDPSDATGNTIVCWVNGPAAAGDGGIWRTTTAKGAATFTQSFTTTVASVRAAFAVNQVSGVTTMIAATGEAATGTGCTSGSGCLRRSTDGGITWSAKLAGAGGFCGGQCFYDLPVALQPTNASVILVGGAGNGTCTRVYARSTNAGASFTGAGVADVGLHADAHAIVFAPTNPNLVFEGSDGGIWKSTDAGATWTSMNNVGFAATQFQSIAVHPTNTNFTIGGTQDNGTNYYRPGATWRRIDSGDGGFAQIDRNAPDTSTVVMYHTYFSQTGTQNGYSRCLTGSPYTTWSFSGNGGNGIPLTDVVNFYAPLVLGPGAPNTVYYGSDRLYRSINRGNTNTVVSQAPIVSGVPISAVSIHPANDNLRLVGLNNGTVWITTTGASTLTNVTGSIPAKYVGRIAMDPNNQNVAYVSLCGFGLPAGQHVWKATNVLSGTPTWAASGTGLPDVPVNSMVVDPGNSNQVFAGTDIGVYVSNDAGANWLPFNTGLPIVAIFDMAIQPTSRILRIATHGRGMWERTIALTTPVLASAIGTEFDNGIVKLSWYVPNGAGRAMNLMRRPVPGDWATVKQVKANAKGEVGFEDASAIPGRTYEYALGLTAESGQVLAGHVWVDVPTGVHVALQRISPNPSSRGFTVTFALSSGAPANLELVDVTGRQLKSIPVGTMGVGAHQVDMGRSGELSAGVYFVRLNQAGRTFSKRVVVVK